MTELWDLLLSAQESSTGIPEIFMTQKKEEIKQRKVTQSKPFLILDVGPMLMINS